VEVFSIFPPALDEIHRWLRDQARMEVDKVTEESKGKAEGVEKKAKRRMKREPKGQS